MAWVVAAVVLDVSSFVALPGMSLGLSWDHEAYVQYWIGAWVQCLTGEVVGALAVLAVELDGVFVLD